MHNDNALVSWPPAAVETSDEIGFWEALLLPYAAWKSERVSDAQRRILTAKKQLLAEQHAIARMQQEAQIQGVETLLQARIRVAQALRTAEEAEEEVHFHRTLRQATPEAAQRILGADVATQQLLLQREQARQHRLQGGATPLSQTPMALPAGTGSAPAIEARLSDKHIEALALKAYVRFAALEPDKAEEAWAAWHEELPRRFPAFTAAEIARRAKELRGSESAG